MSQTEGWQNPAPDIISDINAFHERFGLRQPYGKQPVRDPNPGETGPNTGIDTEEWKLRHKRLVEEFNEYKGAFEINDEVEILDALVDLVYIALGTAYRRGWDFGEAWKRVHQANMEKERGTAGNSKFGSSFDIIKPEGWRSPDLSDLVGQNDEERELQWAKASALPGDSDIV